MKQTENNQNLSKNRDVSLDQISRSVWNEFGEEFTRTLNISEVDDVILRMIPLKRYFLPACKYTCRIIQPDNTSNHLNILRPGVSANLTGMPKYSSLSMIGEGQLWTGFIVFSIPNFIQTAPCKNLTNVIPPKRNNWLKRNQ